MLGILLLLHFGDIFSETRWLTVLGLRGSCGFHAMLNS
jgi:hypothetical protein